MKDAETAISEGSLTQSVVGFDGPSHDCQTIPKKRLAVRAAAPAATLVSALEQTTGHGTSHPNSFHVPEAGSVVRVIGWRVVRSSRGGAHLAYTILSASASRTKKFWSEARLVPRRYRDFVKLHGILYPIAREAQVVLPPLPSKVAAFGRNLSPSVGAHRQRALHDWLQSVISQPLLMTEHLRVFLGLSPTGAPEQALGSSPHATYENGSAEDHASMSDDDDSCANDQCTEAPNGFSMPLRNMGTALLKARAGLCEDRVSVDLSALEQEAVDCMLDDNLWGRS